MIQLLIRNNKHVEIIITNGSWSQVVSRYDLLFVFIANFKLFRVENENIYNYIISREIITLLLET